MNKNFPKILQAEKDIEQFLEHPEIIYDICEQTNLLVVSDKPGEIMCSILDSLDIIIAGGGIVSNESDELLLIFRRGKWDLPKGKIELNEEIIIGAVREVEEETGVKIAHVDSKPTITYHTYKMKGNNYLKETNWFTMKARESQKNLTPQTEEDIEEVRWVSKKDLGDYKSGSYPLIWDLLKQYAPEKIKSI